MEFRDTRLPFRLTNNPTPGVIKLVGFVFHRRQARNLIDLAQSVTGFQEFIDGFPFFVESHTS